MTVGRLDVTTDPIPERSFDLITARALLHHLPTCPLPLHPLRNGRLNQTAYSLFLFCRDVAEGELTRWS